MFNSKQVNKLTKKAMKTLNTKLVLYLVAFLSLVSVAGQLFARNYKYVSSFVVLGIVTAYFTKSMSLILLVPLVVVNLLVSANYIKEGMKDKKEQTLDEMKAELEEKQAELEEKQATLEEKPGDKKLEEEVKKIEKHVEDLENKIVLKESEEEETQEEESEESEEEEDVMTEGMTEGSEEVVDLQKIMESMEPKGKTSNMKKSKVSSLKPKEENVMEIEEEMEQMKNRKKRDGFRPKKRLVHRGKAKYLNPEKDTDEAVGETIDYASTLEQAYGNLQKMMGKGGMKGLTQETSKLVNQQKELMDSLKSMAPALNDAKKTLSGFNIPNMGDMKKMLGSIQQQ